MTRQSTFKTFFLWGGPSSVAGTLDIAWYKFLLAISALCSWSRRTETGVTLSGKQSFSSFLGPMFTELTDKYRQWLELTYSASTFSLHAAMQPLTIFCAAKDQLLRCKTSSPDGPSTTPCPELSPTPAIQPTSAAAASPSPTPVAQLSPTPVVQPSPTLVAQPSPAPVAQPSPAPIAQPSPAPVVQSSPTPVAQPSSAPVVQSSPTPTVPPPSTPAIQPPPATIVQPPLTPVVLPASTLVIQPFPTTAVQPDPVPMVQVPPAPADQLLTLTPTETQDPVRNGPTTEQIPTNPHLDLTMATPELEPSPPCPDPDPTALTTTAPPLISVPAGRCSKFITSEVLASLSGVTGFEGWSDFVEMYLKFETTSESKSVRTLPTSSASHF